MNSKYTFRYDPPEHKDESEAIIDNYWNHYKSYQTSLHDSIQRYLEGGDYDPEEVNKKEPREGTLGTQVAGNHYQGVIQPIEFIVANEIPYREANVIKYVFRHSKKNGVEDLKKARHYLNMIIEEYEKKDAS